MSEPKRLAVWGAVLAALVALAFVLDGCAEHRTPVTTDAAASADAGPCDPAEVAARYAARLDGCEAPPCALACDAYCESALMNATASGMERCADLAAVCAAPLCAGAP